MIKKETIKNYKKDQKMSKNIFLLFLSPINIVNLQWIQSFWTYYPAFFRFINFKYYIFAMDISIFFKN